MTWAVCATCNLQVHTLYTRFLLQGIDCPTCGARLLDPTSEPSELLTQALRQEDQFSQRLSADEQ